MLHCISTNYAKREAELDAYKGVVRVFLSSSGRLIALLVGILKIMQEKNYLSRLVIKLIK